MFNSTSLKSAFIVATVSMLTAGGVWPTENKRDESKPQSGAGQSKESGVTIAEDSAVSQAQSLGNDHRAKRADVGDGITMEFVRIPPGSFYMDMGPFHQVQIIKPFYMGKYEVTQAQWKVVMGTTVSQQRNNIKPSWHLKGVGPEHPIYCVSWEEAAEFCKRLGSNFRLPDQSEWEYACRAGSKTDFYYGDNPDYSQLDSYAWHYNNSKGSTHPVGRKKSNRWGLYDMYGNVSEWCSDRFVSGDYVIDVCRGGSWFGGPESCQSAGRDSGSIWPDGIGFRVVFAGNLDDGNKILEIALPKETAGLNIAQEKKPEIKPVTRMAITGVVRDDAGIPIDGVYMQIPPLPSDWHLREYPEGRFEAYRYTNSSQTSIRKYHFYARHLQRNLVAFMEFNEDANTLDIKLKPGAILTGKVVDADGKGIQGTEVSLYSHDSRMLPIQVIMEPDTKGNFEIKALPLGQKYLVGARATGYRMREIEVSSGNAPGNRIEAGPIVLARGQFTVSGVVVNRKGKSVANASVHCTGNEQVNILTQTDANGRFTAYGIFEGPVLIIAYIKEDSSGEVSYGQKHSYSGATNVKVALKQKTR